MNCWLCENQSVCEIHDPALFAERLNAVINNLFDVGVDNVHMVDVDGFEYTKVPEAPPKPMVTQAQLDYLKSLFNQRTANEKAMVLRAHLLGEYKAGKLTRKMASEAIDDIKGMERNRPDYREPSQISPNLEHGQVWTTIGGTFVKVVLNQQGTSFYGKHWVPSTKQWEYHPQALKTIDHLVTAEEAKEFSLQWDAENRYCIFCMKHLSDERSEFAGYGETCAGNNGLPWGATNA